MNTNNTNGRQMWIQEGFKLDANTRMNTNDTNGNNKHDVNI